MLIGTLSSSVETDSQSSTSVGGIGSEQCTIDKLTGFHLQSGIVDKSWILLDSGASANCCPPWFADDYPLLSVG